MTEEKNVQEYELNAGAEVDTEMSLEEFLAQNNVENLTDEIVLSERLKDYKFKIGSMSRKELENYQKLCIARNGKGKMIKQDTMKFNDLIVVNHCLYPNFKSQDFLQKLGVNTPSEAIAKVLKTGEIATLAEKIMEFNGFEDYEDIREKAKN